MAMAFISGGVIGGLFGAALVYFRYCDRMRACLDEVARLKVKAEYLNDMINALTSGQDDADDYCE